jgi:hypothetical protein
LSYPELSRYLGAALKIHAALLSALFAFEAIEGRDKRRKALLPIILCLAFASAAYLIDA